MLKLRRTYESAPERYQSLIKHPNLLNRINLGHIASYVGVTQETLSRIRKGQTILMYIKKTTTFLSTFEPINKLDMQIGFRMQDIVPILTEPEMQFWGDLKARIQDPFVYIWDLAEKAN